MSKELTEQWKNRTLEDGDYYVRKEYDTIIEYYYDNHWEWAECEQDVKEVLAPVPSYDEYNELVQKTHILEKQLGIVTKALKMIDPEIVPFKDFDHRGVILWSIAQQALKEIDLVGTSEKEKV